MKNIPRPYKLLICNTFPEKQFIKIYGQELFAWLKNEAFILDRGKCAACEHEPPQSRKNDCLFFHLFEVNKANPELSKGITLCKACHLTQHIDSAIKKKLVIFVNSIHDQNNIIRLTRSNQIYGALSQRSIVELKKTPEQFSKEWCSGESRPSPTLKVIFTNNFTIDDLY